MKINYFDTLSGGDGNDSWQLGDQDYRILAGAGKNKITGGGGDNWITALSGNDRIQLGDGGNVAEVGDGNNTVTAGHGSNTVIAGDGKDSITLGDGANTVDAGDGDNRISLGNGSGQVRSGTGKDQYSIGNGSYSIVDTGGANKITALDGNLDISTGAGKDTITLGNGSNRIDAGGGQNRITAGDGDNIVTTGDGKDQVALGDGSNRIDAGDGANMIKAGNGNNFITSGLGSDKVYLGSGENTLWLGGGSNYVKAKGGILTVTAGAGSDKFYFGNGSATIQAGAGKDTVQLGTGDFSVSAAAGDNSIRARGGSLDLRAGDGNDKVTFGDGNVVLDLAGGHNTVSVKNGQADITAGDGNNKISTGTGEISITLGDGGNSVKIGGGSGTEQLGDGKNKLSIRDGDFDIVTGAGADQISQKKGQGRIDSGAGNDRISAGDGGVEVDAGAGNDQIKGGNGDDTLIGGSGNDKISGGRGYDIARFDGSIDDFSITLKGKNVIVADSREGMAGSGPGQDTLDGIEAIYFEQSGTTVDLTGAGAPLLFDDQITADGEGTLQISADQLLSNDLDLFDAIAGISVDGTSESGLRISFDGNTIVFNADDELQHLAAGETYTDSFTYTATTHDGATVEATVNVTLSGEDNDHVAGNDLLSSGGIGSYSFAGGDEFTISDTPHKWNSDGSVTQIADGNLVVVWSGLDVTNPAPNHTQFGVRGVFGKVIDADGNTISGPFPVSPEDEFAIASSVVALPDGGFAVTWYTKVQADLSYPTPNDGDGPNPDGAKSLVLWRSFSADGEPAGPAVTVLESDAYYAPWSEAPFGSIEVSALPDGNILMTWQEGTLSPVSGTPEGNYEVYSRSGNTSLKAAVISPAGNIVTPAFSVGPDGHDSFRDVKFSVMPDGSFCAVWVEDGEVWLGGYNTAGAETIEPVRVNAENLAGSDIQPNLSVNDDGNIVVTWKHQDGTGNDGDSYLHGKIYNPDGSVAVEQFEISGYQDARHFEMYNDVQYLPNGQFVVAWHTYPAEDYVSGHYQHDIFARIYNSDGTAATETFLVNQETGDQQWDMNITVIGGGSFMISWSSEQRDGGQTYDVAGRIYDLEGNETDAFFAREDWITEIDILDLLANDVLLDAEGFEFRLEGGTSELGAELTYDAELGILLYDPTAAGDIRSLAKGETAEDRFSYSFEDVYGNSNSAEVTIVVGGVDSDQFF